VGRYVQGNAPRLQAFTGIRACERSKGPIPAIPMASGIYYMA